MVYTGKSPDLTEQDLKLLTTLCEELGMDTSVMNKANHENIDQLNNGLGHLKMETEINSVISDEKFVLRMPFSRIEHSNTKSSMVSKEGSRRNIIDPLLVPMKVHMTRILLYTCRLNL